MTQRPYQQTRRAEASGATRSKIVLAARDQLLSGRAFTIDAVARRASVTRATVYAQFASRDELRESVFDQLAESGGLHIPEAFTQHDPVLGLRRFVEVFCVFYGTHRMILRRLNALAIVESDPGAHQHHRNDRRRQALTVLVERVANEAPYLTDPTNRAAAVSLAHALTSFEFFDQISSESVSESEVPDHVFALVTAALHVTQEDRSR